MNGLLLCCRIEILGVLQCGARYLADFPKADLQNRSDQNDSSSTSPTAPPSIPEASSLMVTQLPKTVACSSSHPSALPSVGQTPNWQEDILNRKACFPVLIVSGALILACTILLVCVCLFAWRMCLLRLRFRALRGKTDLISNSDSMETARKSKRKSTTAPKEVSMVMDDFNQAQEVTGTTTEEGGVVNKDSKKEGGDTTNSEEALTSPTAINENPSSSSSFSSSSSTSKPKEEVTDSGPP